MSGKATASQSLKCMRIANYIVKPRLDEGTGFCQGLPNSVRNEGPSFLLFMSQYIAKDTHICVLCMVIWLFVGSEEVMNAL